jgi:hypothetical protein
MLLRLVDFVPSISAPDKTELDVLSDADIPRVYMRNPDNIFDRMSAALVTPVMLRSTTRFEADNEALARMAHTQNCTPWQSYRAGNPPTFAHHPIVHVRP